MTAQKSASDGSVATTMSTSADSSDGRAGVRAARHLGRRRVSTTEHRQDDDHREQERPEQEHCARDDDPDRGQENGHHGQDTERRCAAPRRLRTRRGRGVAVELRSPPQPEAGEHRDGEQAEQDRSDGLPGHLAVLVEDHVERHQQIEDADEHRERREPRLRRRCPRGAQAGRTSPTTRVAADSSLVPPRIATSGHPAPRAACDRRSTSASHVRSRRCSRAARTRRTRSRRVERHGTRREGHACTTRPIAR